MHNDEIDLNWKPAVYNCYPIFEGDKKIFNLDCSVRLRKYRTCSGHMH